VLALRQQAPVSNLYVGSTTTEAILLDIQTTNADARRQQGST